MENKFNAILKFIFCLIDERRSDLFTLPVLCNIITCLYLLINDDDSTVKPCHTLLYFQNKSKCSNRQSYICAFVCRHAWFVWPLRPLYVNLLCRLVEIRICGCVRSAPSLSFICSFSPLSPLSADSGYTPPSDGVLPGWAALVVHQELTPSQR